MSKAQPPCDLNELSNYLQNHVKGFGRITGMQKFEGGQSNPTYKLDCHNNSYVLRAKPPGELLKSAHQVDREYRIMKALEGSEVPVPRVHHLSETDSNPIGRVFFIMEFLDGRIFWDPALPEIENPEQRAAIYDAMNATLAELHSINIDTAGLTDFGKPGDYFARQLTRWTKQYEASETEPNQDLRNLIKWLKANLPPDDGQISLVHGDYRLDNMVFANKDTEVLGILDWELSTLGHPLADLAYQCMQWRLPHSGGFRGLGGIEREVLGIPSEGSYVANYCKRRGIETLPDWPFYMAFSFFRLAAILQGVYKRSLDGNASNPQKAKQYGMAVPILGSMASEYLKEEDAA